MYYELFCLLTVLKLCFAYYELWDIASVCPVMFRFITSRLDCIVTCAVCCTLLYSQWNKCAAGLIGQSAFRPSLVCLLSQQNITIGYCHTCFFISIFILSPITRVTAALHKLCPNDCHLDNLRTLRWDYAHSMNITIFSGTWVAACDKAGIFDRTGRNADLLHCLADYWQPMLCSSLKVYSVYFL